MSPHYGLHASCEWRSGARLPGSNGVDGGSEPLRGGADALEAALERVGGAAVALDVVDRGFGAGDPELDAEEEGDGLGFGLAGGVVGAGAPYSDLASFSMARRNMALMRVW